MHNVRFIFKGDKRMAMRFLPQAQKELTILKNSSSLYDFDQKLRLATVCLDPYVTVRCIITPLITFVTITAQVVSGKKKAKKYIEYCWCGPCLGMGIIQGITTAPEDTAYRNGAKFKYSVLVCTDDAYVLLEDDAVVSESWAEYYEGQYVLVGVDVGGLITELPSCCSNDTCIFKNLSDTTKLEVNTFCIYPVHTIGEMLKVKKKWIS